MTYKNILKDIFILGYHRVFQNDNFWILNAILGKKLFGFRIFGEKYWIGSKWQKIRGSCYGNKTIVWVLYHCVQTVH